MTVTRLNLLREQLAPVNREMSVATPFWGQNYQAGLIAFQVLAERDDKFITHATSDVLAHILEGHGRLRLSDSEVALGPGLVCHVPAGTAHDFVAEDDTPLLLFYALIDTNQSEELDHP